MPSFEPVLDQRLQKIMHWAKSNDIYLPGSQNGLTFSILGKKEARVLTIYFKDNAKNNIKGTMYAYASDKFFPNGSLERDAFVHELKNLNLLTSDYNPDRQTSHKHLEKKIQELSDKEFAEFVSILEKYFG